MSEFSSLPLILSNIAFQHSAIGKALVDADGRWLDVNNALCNLTGYSKAELLGLTLQEISHPDDVADNTVLIEKLRNGKCASHQLEKRYIRKDKSVVWILLSIAITAREGARSTPESPIFIVEAIDITRHKQAEADRHLFGDEFVILLEDVMLDRAKQLAQEVLLAGSHGLSALSGAHNLSATIGIAVFNHAESAADLLARADEAMYVAKRTGKNRVALRSDGQWIIISPG